MPRLVATICKEASAILPAALSISRCARVSSLSASSPFFTVASATVGSLTAPPPTQRRIVFTGMPVNLAVRPKLFSFAA